MSSSRSRNRPAASVACSSKRPAALVAFSSSRRRRKVAAAAATTQNSSSWVSLPEDLVSLIGWRVLAGDLRDYIRFRAVCSHWRSSTTCPRGRGIVDPRFHPRRWMMLPEGHRLHPGHGKLRGYVRFFNLSTGALVRVRLPLFRDHCVLDSADGILLLQRDHDTAVRLLHPFTGDIAEFPPLETLLPYVNNSQFIGGDKRRYLRTICATSISVGADDGVVRVTMFLQYVRYLSFATSGDEQWRVPTPTWGHALGLDNISCYSPLPFQGKLYMLHRPEIYTKQHEILQIDPPQLQEDEDMDLPPSLPPPKLIAECPARTENGAFMSYLVECNSEMLVINLNDYKYSVYRVADLMLGRSVPLTSINRGSLFLDTWRSLYVSSEAFPVIEGDTIVFCRYPENYLSQYHLNSGTVSVASEEWTEGAAALSPSSIIYHIYTCCPAAYVIAGTKDFYSVMGVLSSGG